MTVIHVCRACGEVKPISDGLARHGQWICGECRRALRPKATIICPVCAKPRTVTRGNEGSTCQTCCGRTKIRGLQAEQQRARDALVADLIAEAGRFPASCIEWPKCRDLLGYGKVADGTDTLASRIIWKRKFGPIPHGMCVLHHCDNPPCVNFNHLWLGTMRDNTRDMMAKGRHRFFGRRWD